LPQLLLPQLLLPLSQLRHLQLLHQPLQQVFLHQPLQLLLRKKKRRQMLSLQKVSLLRKSQLKQTQKPLLHPHQQLSKSEVDDDDGFEIDDEVTFGRNRKADRFGKVVDEDIELSDYVRFRLWLARQLALMKYQQSRA
jgi:hypothetical protein